ncbi:MAG: mechanosensitive ion channel domain-containing protein [Candidatus Omnitrophota bacterium]|jgi:small conductance mechanosensitive channel
MEKIMDRVSGYVIQYGMQAVAAVVIFIVGKWLARISSRLIGQVMGRSKINDTLVSFTKNIAYYVILIFVAIAALNKLGVETTSFVAIVGAAGLAVGLALQGSLSNFAAGVMLILFQPFKVGDEIEAGGASGIVKEIQIFSTIMMAKDNKKVIVPNAKIAGDKITITPH